MLKVGPKDPWYHVQARKQRPDDVIAKQRVSWEDIRIENAWERVGRGWWVTKNWHRDGSVTFGVCDGAAYGGASRVSQEGVAALADTLLNWPGE